ncbi:MAG: M1 family metallopeptidase [Candidatus Hodarchaeales archaeon]
MKSRKVKIRYLIYIIAVLVTLALNVQVVSVKPPSFVVTPTVKQKETFLTIDSIDTNTPAAIPTQEETSQYNISVVFDPSACTATGWTNVSYLNTEAIPLNEIYFHIWPKHDSPDAIIIHSILDKSDVLLNFEVENTVNLRVDLPTTIQPQERGIIKIQFTTKLPIKLDRFGANPVVQLSGYIYAFTNWHPVLSVYEEGAWNKNPYFSLGEAFYADMAYYRINISAPSAQLLAGAGDLKNVDKNGETNEYFWIAGPVREFSWFANDKWEVESKMHNDVNISCFHYPGHEEGAIKALNVTANCIDLFSELLEPWPYKSVAIIEYPSVSMEYSQAVLITDNFIENPEIEIPVGITWFNLEKLVVHELSHAWNHFIIGNDPFNEPWLDEGWAKYSEYLYVVEYLGQEIADQEQFDYKKKVFNEFLKTYIDDTPIIMNATYYLNLPYPDTYYLIVYGKANFILHQLRFVMGDVKFFSSLEAFYETFSYKTITTEDFKQVFEQTSNITLDWFFDQYVYNKGYPKYNITSFTYSEINGSEIGGQLEITIKQEQPDPMINLIPITLEFENTSSSQILKENYTVWVNQSTETIQFDVPAGYRPIRMQVDPEWRLFRENTIIEFPKSSTTPTTTSTSTSTSTPTSTTPSTSAPGWTSLLILMSMLMVLLINRKLKRMK